MKLKSIAFIIGLIALYNCSSKPTLTVLCELDKSGNYILKWEIYPDVDSTQADIYISDNDSVFPSVATMVVSANDYIAVIKPDERHKRRYFKINIKGTLSEAVSNRFFEMDSIQNFRDIGGYTTGDGRTVRWGKIFRSGSFYKMTKEDSLELNSLKIKTVIDLRPEDSKLRNPDRYKVANNIRLPIALNGYSSIANKVFEGKLLRGDAVIYTQDTYRDMVNNFASEYAQLFDYLCDENNYPIAYQCFLGKDQSGLATYFLLRALDVNADMIEEDYMGSNLGIRPKLLKGADSLTEARQEALTMLTKTDIAYLKYGLSCIREKSGSIDNYMIHDLKLTPEKRKKLRSILLH